MSERSEALADGMLDGPKEVAGIELRPFTLGSLQAARKLGLRMFAEDPSDEEIEPGQEEREMVAFAWIQSAPLSEVLGSLRKGVDVAWEKIDEFSWSLDMDRFQLFSQELEKLGMMVGETIVEVVPKDQGGKDETPPGKS